VSCAALPLPPNARVSSPFGVRLLNGRSDLHTGVDVAASEGTPVFAMLDGVAVLSAPSGRVSGYGNVIVLQHGPALYSLSAHLSQRLVQAGALVQAGSPIGLVGRTAGTPTDPSKVFAESGSHLHFEFLSKWPPAGKDLDRLDPGPVLAALGIIVPSQGPLMLACSSSPSSSAPVWANVPPSSPSAGVVAGVGGSLLALAALAFALHKQKRRAA
jgi:murein DD-endopeptidase MepM/ murein hydrolase activator NlpD